MHLLQAGIPLIITIKNFLGHADVKSTEVYVQIDVGMKREALTLAGSPTSTTPKAPRLSKDLVAWLEAL
jgi:integrase